MLWSASSVKGYAIEASDGQLGTVRDVLFDDQTWKTRWLVVHTGLWLLGRDVLLPLSALGTPDQTLRQFPVQLTRQQVKDSPNVDLDLPVSRQIEASVYGYYNWNPYWGSMLSPIGTAVGAPVFMSESNRDAKVLEPSDHEAKHGDQDPSLRSAAAVIGYHIEATDGAVGHAEDFLVDGTDGQVRYLIVDTKNWLPGKRVVISPQLIREIDWTTRAIYLNVKADMLKSSPAYDPVEIGSETFNDHFHQYFFGSDS